MPRDAEALTLTSAREVSALQPLQNSASNVCVHREEYGGKVIDSRSSEER